MEQIKLSRKGQNLFDFVIIGGGITGSITSIQLTKQGYRVALIERSNLEHFKPGESLAPRCRNLIDNLGIALRLEVTKEYFGNSSRWGSDELVSTDFIFNPYGNGVSVDRAGFELSLIGSARDSGVAIFLQTQILQMRPTKSGYLITVNNDRRPIESKIAIIATGRNSSLRGTNTSKTFFDKLVSLTTVIDVEDGKQGDNFLNVESHPLGWLYTNRIPGNRRVISFFTDGDILPADRNGFFNHVISQTQWVKDNISSKRQTLSVAVFDARSYFSNFTPSRSLLTMGDSLYTIDPLSGQGLEKNIDMVNFFSAIAAAFYNGDEKAAHRWEDYNQTRFHNYREQQVLAYSAETRWNTYPFWQRRVHHKVTYALS